jgi:hypothetical protein
MRGPRRGVMKLTNAELSSVRQGLPMPLRSTARASRPHFASLRRGASNKPGYTRSMYAPESVFTRIFAPDSMNSGTFTTSPVSVVAGFVPPVAVSPL